MADRTATLEVTLEFGEVFQRDPRTYDSQRAIVGRILLNNASTTVRLENGFLDLIYKTRNRAAVRDAIKYLFARYWPHEIWNMAAFEEWGDVPAKYRPSEVLTVPSAT